MGEMNQGVGRLRWGVCTLLFFATTINYMDRQILGILAPVLEKEIGWNEMEYGRMVMAFQAAYAIGLIAFGRSVDLMGTKIGYAVAITIWSLAAMGHGLARSVFGFGVARFLLGLGEAGNFPAAIKAVAEWFPKKERALATGIFNSGANVGAVLAPLVVPWLTLHFGWKASFVVLGALGFLWLIFWWRFYGDPQTQKNLSASERAHILSDPVESGGTAIPWRKLFGFRQTWIYVVGMTLSSPVWWFYLYWLPKFLYSRYSLDLAHLGMPLVVIYSMTCVGSIGGGLLSSRLIARGWAVGTARKTALLVCALCVTPVTLIPEMAGLWPAVLVFGLALAAHQGWSANLYTMVSDMFPKNSVASVVGVGSMFGSVAAMLFAWVTGAVLQKTANYWPLLIVCGLAYLTALLIMHFIMPRVRPAETTDFARTQ